MLSEYRSGGIRAVLCRCPTVLVKDKFYHVRCQRFAFLFAWRFLWLRFVCFGQVLYDNAGERLLVNIFVCFKHLIDYNGDFFCTVIVHDHLNIADDILF